MMRGLLSVVLPSFNEEAMIERAALAVGSILQQAQIPHELIFVDDGSKDKTWERVQAVAAVTPTVRGVHFSRNFGKESAILAGLSQARGNCCAVIDCDLQHPPEKLVEMYDLWEQGYDVVEGQKSSRGKESGLHAFAAHMFYKIISGATGIDMANASDFKLLDRKAVDTLIQMPERGAFFRALSSWIGFRVTSVTFDVREREAGESKWSTKSLIKYALNNITAFSNVPMQFVTITGVLCLLAFFVLGVAAIVRLIIGSYVGIGTVLALLLLLIGGVSMIALGVIGFYIGRIYDEIKHRPRFIIAATCGTDDEA